MKIKLGLKIATVDGFPPFEVEHLWFLETDNRFQLINYPFFVQELSFMDVIDADIDENNYVKTWKIFSKSSNSTIQIYLFDKYIDLSFIIDFKCQFEGAPLDRFFSINIKNESDIYPLCKKLQKLRESGKLEICMASIRDSRIIELLQIR